MPPTPLPEEEIFQAARRIESVAARQEYLDHTCGDDIELRARVEALLAALESSESFLESPAPEISAETPTAHLPIAECTGDVIGPYKLLQQIGEGGMGIVYMAEQTEPIERRVALKIIKPGMDTRQVIARFEAERQALAMMDHPHIAKVLDAGVTDTGRPYFVMELVKGIPITEYCDEHNLTPRERLELIVPVCQAVQHAHQKGIIHRDIKPSNVLVAHFDDKPMPKVIDFGVAKAVDHRLTEKTMFTEFGQVLGTFEYMSPEQARLNQWDVDTRTDVYSLGVLLYELLSGETPFDRQRLRSAAFDELLRIIREEEPPRPSTRISTSQSLPAIAAKRNTEPKKLSTVIHGELDWIVMKALEKDRTRRYETVSKLAEDVNHFLKNETVEACPPSASYRLRKFAHRNKSLLATMTVVAAALLIGAALAIWQAREARSQRSLALRKADEAQREATKAAAVANLLEEMLSTADPGDTTLKEIMDAFGDTLDDRLAGQPDVQIEVRRILGVAYMGLQQYDEAERHLSRARELHLTLHDQTDPQMAALLSDIVELRWLTDPGKDISALVNQLAAIHAKSQNLAGELGAKDKLVRSLVYQGRIEEAEQAAVNYLKAIERNGLTDSFDYAGLKVRLSVIKNALGERQATERLINEAIALVENRSQPWPPRSYWWFYENKGSMLLAWGDFPGAEATLRECLEITRALFPEDNFRVRSTKLGLVEALEAQPDAASQQELDELLASFPKHEIAHTARYKAKWTLIRKRNVERALQFARRAIEIEPDDGQFADETAYWAATSPYSIYRESGVPIQFSELAIDAEPDVADYWTTLGIARYRAGEHAKAMEALDKAVALRGEASGIDAFFLAMTNWRLDKQTEARNWYHQAVGWAEANRPEDEELLRFRSEAAELLRIEDADVTAPRADK